MTDRTVPSGESERLEERIARALYDHNESVYETPTPWERAEEMDREDMREVARKILPLVADEMARLTAEVARYREALEEARRAAAPFLAALESYEESWERAQEPGEEGPLPDDLPLRPRLTTQVPLVGHARALRAALTTEGGDRE